MNHARLISDIIEKYRGTAIEKDIRKVIKYLESYYRMFSLHFVKDRPLPAMSVLDAEIDAMAAPYEQDPDAIRSISSVIIAVMDAVVSPGTANAAEIKAKISAIEDPELQAVARRIGSLVAGTTAATVADAMKGALSMEYGATEARQ